MSFCRDGGQGVDAGDGGVRRPDGLSVPAWAKKEEEEKIGRRNKNAEERRRKAAGEKGRETGEGQEKGRLGRRRRGVRSARRRVGSSRRRVSARLITRLRWFVASSSPAPPSPLPLLLPRLCFPPVHRKCIWIDYIRIPHLYGASEAREKRASGSASSLRSGLVFVGFAFAPSMATPTIALPPEQPPDANAALPELPAELLLTLLTKRAASSALPASSSSSADALGERDALDRFVLSGAGALGDDHATGVHVEDVLNELLPDGAPLFLALDRPAAPSGE